MQQANLALVPLALGILGGLAMLAGGIYLARRTAARAAAAGEAAMAEARRDAENQKREILVAAQEHALAAEE